MAEFKPKIFEVGAKDWDRKLFDELIPLPDGTSYNAYFIEGSQKNALIDTVDPSKTEILIENLNKINVKKIDYLIANHAEQDHSGSISKILKQYPDAKVVTNQKCKGFLIDLLLLKEDDFIVITDNETLSLGDKRLKFMITPWVHWPETMITYLEEDKILFSCDLFGSHLATNETFVTDENKILEDAKRYYAEIMMPFRVNIIKHLQRVDELDIEMIAPSHGPIYNKPEMIINAYKEWTSDQVKNEVIIPYVSMHESTKKMVDYLIDSLIKREITVKPFNLTVTDIGELAISLVDAATIILATPTVLTGPHPSAVYAAFLTNALRPKTKFLSVIGSYGWAGKAVDVISSLLPNMKAEIIEPVMIKGYPKDEDLNLLDELAEKITKKHKELKIL